ncbi:MULTISPECIES: glycosyltransferase family 2 protein [Sphingobium]|uniref:glycosyltransferase family 2 protein n=1 Tax=Sphingobium TaxID=165695 RepID=UPI001844FD91|nr:MULTISPECIES: glycosyltransferase family 2 protein [Sphingobium]MCW2363620.1 dolichol-phosphate mannosyltransferase [Sphingobium sp. B10D3B]MCW2402982.1 dolichol-phosphate mannosyltransferase [Sphingobium sp. B10D7B]MCW2409960.1 dolichol-phosphate mannosyltransferase [Sphingobium xanthum]
MTIQTMTEAPVAAQMLPAELAIVVPTFNEAQNVALLADLVDKALPGVAWELVFVDDNSPDDTSGKVRALAQRDPRVRVLHRFGRRGLSSACVEGILATSAPYVAIMDADLQHDESVLKTMFERIRADDVDLVVGSRYVEGGGMGDWSESRQRMSQFATKLALKLTKTPISDPMSGFMMMRRDAFMRSLPNLSTVGFKILLDIAASAPTPLRVAEVPYTFRTRQFGESKLDSLVLWEYVQLLMDKAVGHIVPVRFLSFAMVGGTGVVVHFAVLTLLFVALGVSFAVAQTAATLVAITSNFLLNNMFTYRDQRLQGWGLLRGWITFNLVCAFGAAANIGVADWLFVNKAYWALSALAGIMVSVVWNYVMSAFFTWKKKG